MVKSRSRPEAAQSGELWGHKWGFRDTRFVIRKDGSVFLTGDRYDLCGYRMYDFLPYVEEVLETRVDWDRPLSEVDVKPVPPPRRNWYFCRDVEKLFRSDQYTFDDPVRLLHSHGQTSADEVFPCGLPAAGTSRGHGLLLPIGAGRASDHPTGQKAQCLSHSLRWRHQRQFALFNCRQTSVAWR